jgi:branched-chain amino acid transport system ATP-binding protein
VVAVASVDSSLLETDVLCKSFGGLHAVKNVDLSLTRGEIRAIIGPNGAGKTTLVNMISGRIPPTSGRVKFKGRDITKTKAWDRVFRGIVYTFQVTSIFKNLTCYENVALAAQRRLMGGMMDRLVLSERKIADSVQAALLDVGLSDIGDRRADTLPYGHQRLLEVAMALALSPELLILDEPLMGLAQEEILTFCDFLRTISKEVTVLLIEHNVSVVLELAEMITVMDNGEIIAEGTPAEIERHHEVQKAYLGK